MPLSVGNNVTNLTKSAFIGARDENIGRALYEPFDNSDHLSASLAAAKDDFGKTLAGRARVIDARKADVFKVKILNAVQGFAGFQLSTLVSGE
jgi:hypothetical protein